MEQITDTILMIRPAAFRYNEQTAISNIYQQNSQDFEKHQIHTKAVAEFDQMVRILKEHGIDVLQFDDEKDPDSPDAIFPNNWLMFHEDGEVLLCPMFAKNRQMERRKDIIDSLKTSKKIQLKKIIDYTHFESAGKFLEGTGSMVAERKKRLVFAGLSSRTNKELVEKYSAQYNYEPVFFTPTENVNGKQKEIYHTNVMMSVGEDFAVLYDNSITDKEERRKVIHKLIFAEKDLIFINQKQSRAFAGNILQVKNQKGKRFIVMSENALKSLSDQQILWLEKHGEILSVNLEIIETIGGGSARCMMTEVFYPNS